LKWVPGTQRPGTRHHTSSFLLRAPQPAPFFVPSAFDEAQQVRQTASATEDSDRGQRQRQGRSSEAAIRTRTQRLSPSLPPNADPELCPCPRNLSLPLSLSL